MKSYVKDYRERRQILRTLKEKGIPALAFLVSIIGIIIACLTPLEKYTDYLQSYHLLMISLIALSLLLMFFYVDSKGIRDRKLMFLLALAFLSVAIVFFMPEDIGVTKAEAEDNLGSEGASYVLLLSILILLTIALLASCASLYYLLGASPKMADLSSYPLIVVPVVLVFALYGKLFFDLVTEGIPNLNWEILTTAYSTHPTMQAGLRNHLLGTLLLIGLTAAISLPVGVGAGLFISEYGGRLSSPVRFCITSLRAMSVFLLGLAALSIVQHSEETMLSSAIQGANSTEGSFLTASIFLSLLVIPVISRATEEGCRSLPTDQREGSAALGSSEGYTLTRLILPWSLPNIVTGLLLGCAEAAGSLAVILFIAGQGDSGIGPFDQVTGLPLVLWGIQEDMSFRDTMAPYQYSAALLLMMITLSLSIAALFLRNRFSKRYRGAQ